MHRHRLRALALLLAVLAATVLAAAPPAAAGGGCHAPATEGRGTTVALTDLCFTPTVLRVAPGTEVTVQVVAPAWAGLLRLLRLVPPEMEGRAAATAVLVPP